jgi:hypothetical protein
MEPLLMKYCGRCSVSNILTSGNKRFDSLPRLDAYPGGVCWLHSIATCPYGENCSFAAGHVKKGEITDPLADKVIGAIQAGVTELFNKPRTTSPLGKRKWKGQGRGGGTTTPLRCDWGAQSCRRNGVGGSTMTPPWRRGMRIEGRGRR